MAAVSVTLAALMPMAASSPAAAAPVISTGCQYMNEGDYDEPSATGIGVSRTYFAGDAITLTITRNEYSPPVGAWRFEVGGALVSRQSLIGNAIRFTYTFTEDVYSEVFLYAPTNGVGAMKGTCVPTTREAFRINTWPDLPGGLEGEPYETTLGATGGVGPYAWALASGSLPPGLSVSVGGAITGTPTEPGWFEFSITATDSTGLSMTRPAQIEIGQLESDEQWIPLCHRTDEGYEFDVAPASVLEGEGEHGGHGADIIPGPDFGEGGRNWDLAGQVIFWDNCTAPEADLVDVDEDGLDNIVDTDDDGDGILDAVDADDDGDGIPDAVEQAAQDPDGDGVPNEADSDDDGDGIADVADTDDDGDGAPDAQDPDSFVAPDQDRDGTPDALDADDDGDCSVDSQDTDRDGDGIPDASDTDLDNDGVPNAVDVDEDGDGRPNLLDSDVDGDGVANGDESTPTRATVEKSVCPADADPDGDGVPNSQDSDDDGDGIHDKIDKVTSRPWVDTDSDGSPNVKDPDIDNDGVPNVSDPDVDGDGVADSRDKDANADGIVETRNQPLKRPLRIPTIRPGVPVQLTTGASLTVAGQAARVDVSCAGPKQSRAKDAGDVSAPGADGRCVIDKSGSGLGLFVFPGKRTVVTVRVSAPAVDGFHALNTVTTRTVG